MYKTTKNIMEATLADIKEQGLWKEERVITTEQANVIDTTASKGVLNFCANNYLGLSNNKEVIAAAKASYDSFGYGLSSVRFICGLLCGRLGGRHCFAGGGQGHLGHGYAGRRLGLCRACGVRVLRLRGRNKGDAYAYEKVRPMGQEAF